MLLLIVLSVALCVLVAILSLLLYFVPLVKIDEFAWRSLFNFISWRVEEQVVDNRTYAENKERFICFAHRLKPGVTYTAVTHKAYLSKLEADPRVDVQVILSDAFGVGVLQWFQKRFLLAPINLNKLMSELCKLDTPETLSNVIRRNMDLYPDERLGDSFVKGYFVKIRLKH